MSIFQTLQPSTVCFDQRCLRRLDLLQLIAAYSHTRVSLCLAVPCLAHPQVIPYLTVYAVLPSSVLFLVAYSWGTQRFRCGGP